MDPRIAGSGSWKHKMYEFHKNFTPENMVEIGERGMLERKEIVRGFIKKGAHFYSMWKVRTELGINGLVKELDHAYAGTDAVYVHFDMDVIGGAGPAPGDLLGELAEPIGMTDYEVIRIAHEIGRRGATGFSFICIPPGSAVTYRVIVYVIMYLLAGKVLGRRLKISAPRKGPAAESRKRSHARQLPTRCAKDRGRQRSGEGPYRRSVKRWAMVRPGWRASKQAAARKTSVSRCQRATICSPTGSPSRVNPHGTLAAGWPVKLKGYMNGTRSKMECAGSPPRSARPSNGPGSEGQAATGICGVSRRSNVSNVPRTFSANVVRARLACWNWIALTLAPSRIMRRRWSRPNPPGQRSVIVPGCHVHE